MVLASTTATTRSAASALLPRLELVSLLFDGLVAVLVADRAPFRSDLFLFLNETGSVILVAAVIDQE